MDKKKVIEAKVDEVMSGKPSEPAQKNTTQKQARPSDEQPEGMPDLSAMFGGAGGAEGMPDLSAMFGKSGMPDLSKIPGLTLRQRLTFKIVGLMSNPKLRFLKSKWSIPLWGVIAILVLTIILSLGILFLIFKLLKAILTPYINIFRKKQIE